MITVDIHPLLSFLSSMGPQQYLFIISMGVLLLAGFALYAVMHIVNTLSNGKKK